MNARKVTLLYFTCLITACVPTKHEQPLTIKSLAGREFVLNADAGIESSRQQAIDRYRTFLDSAPDTPLRLEAARRLADLQLEQGDESAPTNRKSAQGGSDYAQAIQLYRDLLQTYPNNPHNDRILYQLARAYDSTGQTDDALSVLNRLVADYEDSAYIDEARFRRAEMLFIKQDYEEAKQAYKRVLASSEASRLHEQALYKYCWSQFKQERYKDDIDCFIQVLDRKLTGPDVVFSDALLDSMSRADHELVDDTLRVISLSFSYLPDDTGIANYIAAHGNRPYEYLIYASLGELYLIKERYIDAANIYHAFSTHHPDHIKAPYYDIKAIDAYYSGAYRSLVLQGKLEFVNQYGLDRPFWHYHRPTDAPETITYLNKSLVELASHYHARAQHEKNHNRQQEDYLQAVRLYQRFLEYFPQDPQSPQLNFLLAEALFDSGHYDEAAVEYEKTAYQYGEHAKGAEAGYAALLAYRKYEDRLSGDDKTRWHRRSLGSALQFVDRYPSHSQADTVLLNTAEDFFALKELDVATQLATQVLHRRPPVSRELRLSAWTIIGHTAFDHLTYSDAEAAYQKVLELMPRKNPERPAIVENLASSIYKQAEQLRDAGNQEAAIDMFLRVGKLTPTAKIHPVAQYDAAAILITLKQWPRVIAILENFKHDFPDHPLQKEIPAKLAVSYLENGQFSSAAQEFQTIGETSEDPQVQQDALWQSAQMYEKAGKLKGAAVIYKRYIKLFPQPLDQSIEAHQHLADLNRQLGDIHSYHIRLKQIIGLDKQMGKSRTDRSRYLASRAAIVLADDSLESFSKVRLKEPLKKSLKDKKQRMEKALNAYTAALEYGISEITTAATYHIAEIYHDFGRELMKSERPKGLSTEELEQYDILLEEQAYPFEEKAITAHEDNIHHVTEGIYDSWISRSYQQLAELLPVRYAKAEKSEPFDEAIR